MTNPVLEAIAGRRSIRAYKPDQISEEQLQALLDAALQAPSARNLQPWHFTVVQDGALLDRINESVRAELLKNAEGKMKETFSASAYSVFYHAPTVIFLSTDMSAEKRYARHDCGCAAENICLAAHSMGLGTVILGMPWEAFKGPDGDEYRRLLRFPEGYDYMVSVAVGIPEKSKQAHPIAEGLVDYVR